MQIALLGQAHGALGRRQVAAPGPVEIAGHLLQVPADRVQAVIDREALVAREPVEQGRPASGPSTMVTATAWLRATTGLSEISSSRSYRAVICGQSVSSAEAASSCSAAMAACNW